MQEKVKARLRESRLFAPSGRGGASSRNLAFAFSCISVHGHGRCLALWWGVVLRMKVSVALFVWTKRLIVEYHREAIH